MPLRHARPALARLLRLITWAENIALITLLALMIGLAGAQILLRNLFDAGLVSVDQILRLLVLWVALLGAVTASRDEKHINLDVVSRWLPARARAASHALTSLFTLIVCVALAWHAARFVLDERAAGAVAFGSFPVWVAELILPVAFALIALRYLIHVQQHLRQVLARSPRP